MDYTAYGWDASEGGAATPALGTRSSNVHSSPLAAGSHPPVDVSAYEEQPVEPSAAAVAAAVAGGGGESIAAPSPPPPPVADTAASTPPTVSPSPPTSAHASPQHLIDVAAGEGEQPGAAVEVIPPAPLEAGRVGGGTGRNHETEVVSAGEEWRTSVLEPRSEQVDIALPRVLLSGDEEKGRSQTGSRHAMAGDNSGPLLGGNNTRCDRGIDVCGVPDRARGVAVVDDVAGCDLGLLGEGVQGADLRLTDADLMDAAEVLMSSDLFDEELGEEAVGSL